MSVESLWAALRAWDYHPGDPHRSNELEDEIQSMATELGIGGSQLRELIQQWRRAGLDHEAAVRMVYEELR